MDMPSQVQLLKGEASFLKTQMSKGGRTRGDAITSVIEQSRQSKMFEARDSLLEDGLDSLEQKESTGRDMEVMRYEAVDVKGGTKTLVGGLRRDTFGLYTSIR